MALMRQEELINLIRELENKIADELESQDLDFKSWAKDSQEAMPEIAVCFANGGGGHVVYGVEDKVIGLKKAISSIPENLDLNKLINRIYDSTDPHITVSLETVELLPQKKIMIMSVPKATIPCSTTRGLSQVRVGNTCKPLTGQTRLDHMSASGNFDFTAQTIDESWENLISELEIDLLKEKLSDAGLQDYSDLSKKEILQKLGFFKEGKITYAGLLLVGKESALKKYIPNHEWSFSKMVSDVDYDLYENRSTALLSSLSRIIELININNPVSTVKEGLYHFEHRAYPIEALRETILNAFAHRDYGSFGTVIIKNFSNELQVSNPGRFIGGINLSNILYHDPVARNRLLVEILQKIGLVNRSNLGIRRIFRSFLLEGKNPPSILVEGDVIRLIFKMQNFDLEMAKIVDMVKKNGFAISIDILIALNYLKKNRKISLKILESLLPSQIPERYAEVLEILERSKIIRKESGRSKNYTLSEDLYAGVRMSINLPGLGQVDNLPTKAGDKVESTNNDFFRKLIIRELKKQDLPMKGITKITGLDRHTANNILRKMQSEDLVRVIGKGRGSKWSLK